MNDVSDRYQDPYNPAPGRRYAEGTAPVPGYVCRDCGGVIANRQRHDDWHDQQERTQ